MLARGSAGVLQLTSNDANLDALFAQRGCLMRVSMGC